MNKGKSRLTRKVRVLAFVNIYLPGFKGGGPARSLSNMVDSLSDQVKFRIFSSDRDKGDKNSYPGILENDWNKVGKSEVFYAGAGYRLIRNIYRIIKNESYDVLYLNSFFHGMFSVTPLFILRWLMRSTIPVILAPRGEFSPGALAIKRKKKSLYLLIAKSLGFTKDLIWHVSSEYEAAEIKREFGEKSIVVIAPNIPSISSAVTRVQKQKEGVLRLIFLSRISPKKNLLGALNILRMVKEEIEFNIYGPVDDPLYWEKCSKEMLRLPPNIHARYLGEVMPSEVSSVFAQHDLFFFPTHGENFGHVIIESLASGCPVLISDQTPWSDIEECQVGWTIPLSESCKFVEVIEWMATQQNQVLDNYAERSRIYAGSHAGSDEVIKSNLVLFQGVNI